MAEKQLKGIQFPGLSGTYMVPFNEFKEDSEHTGCFFRTVDGETEWMHPPMVAGVEYRTTERHNGKVVYTKLVECGNMPNKSYKYTECGVNALNIIDIKAYAYYADGVGFMQIFPMHSLTTGSITAVCWAEGTTIAINCLYDESRATAKATIKYTKD